ncbi:polyphosphate polymerase domain-containing protein [Schaalia suimastitidis]|uniref:polyphosphate polymerase domain-containing protein n=1 Tax=Schaalia suimastitidis TaxID=121163 RepID=UPI001F0A261B|nr:polyphosphate polymerase domain-containing protein [Schaalia suimastitidis]
MDTVVMERRRQTEATTLDNLETISLNDMVAQAEMLTRVDRKYALPSAELPEIMSHLDLRTRILEIDGALEQRYRSVYFDTADLDSFHDTAHPRRRRFKVRMRSYVDSELSFLEVKTRGPRGRTVKERTVIDCAEVEAGYLSRTRRNWVEEHLEPLGCGRLAWELAPVLNGGYHRTTLLMPNGAGRATVDTGLWWELAGPLAEAGQRSRYEAPVRLVRDDLVVIETKSGSTPSALDHLLWKYGHRPRRISKYATAMAALVPTLSTNRWTQTLRRYF